MDIISFYASIFKGFEVRFVSFYVYFSSFYVCFAASFVWPLDVVVSELIEGLVGAGFWGVEGGFGDVLSNV